MKIFLSSTYLDLIEHRKAVTQALRTMDEEVGHMEVFGARDEEATTVSLEELDKCDVLVGVYAYRYGTVPTGSKASVTEQEYLHAMSKKIPVLVFVVNESHPWPPKSMDKSQAKVKKFKSKSTKEHTPDYFTSPDNLAHKVISSVGRLTKKIDHRPISDSHLPTPEHHKSTGSTLPSQPYFFGRDKELAIIADAISPDSRTWGALIDGPGGIGKTALSIRAAELAPKTLFERKIFISAKVRELTPEGEKPLKDFSRDNYFSMLNELALELGEEGIPRLAPDERANPLRMAMAGKKTLIVFDNLETLSEEERTRLFQFLSRLPEGNKAIVTSRRRADVDARVIRLDRLSADEALALISELAKNNPRLTREDENARHNLYEITNGNPLLIKWVCGQLGREGSAMHTIIEACKFIENAPKDNDPLEYIFGDLLETFTESETKVLAALTHFTQPAKLKWIADVTDLAEQVAETALEDLSDRSILIANNELKEFFLPPLATQFIRKRRHNVVSEAGDNLSERAYILIIENGWDNFEKFSILNSEWQSVIPGILHIIATENRQAKDLISALQEFFVFTGKWDEAIEINRHWEQLNINTNDLYDAGWNAYNAGFFYDLMGQADETLTCAFRAEQHWHLAGAEEKAVALSLQGHGHLTKSDFSAAIQNYEEVLSLLRLNGSDNNRIAISLNYLAEAMRLSGDLDNAEKNYLEGLDIAKEDNDNLNIVTIECNLSLLAMQRRKWVQAEQLGKNALKAAEEFGREDMIAVLHLCIGRALLEQGLSNEGLPHAIHSVDIFSAIHSPRLESAQELLMECELAMQTKSGKKSRNIKKKKKL